MKSESRNTASSHRVTMKDIAAKVGVSINTVSKALTNKRDISSRTKELVFRAARELGCTYEIVMKSWAPRKAYVVGLVIADSANPFFAKVVKGVDATLHQHGYAHSEPEHESIDEDSRAGRFDRQVIAGNPDLIGRQQILRIHYSSRSASSPSGSETLRRSSKRCIGVFRLVFG